MKILVADDEEISRRLLTRMLESWGHEVVTADDGEDAWQRLQSDDIHFVVSDWIMPKISGPELCRRIRSMDIDRYIYVILITGKGEEDAMIEGLDAGADDFMAKPLRRAELKVRLRAGERVLELESRLQAHNQELTAINGRLSKAYAVIRKDLDAAAALQRSLLPASEGRIGTLAFDWMFLPTSFIAGDIFSFFRIDTRHVGVYILDVAGHGLPAALLSVSLNRVLSSRLSTAMLGGSTDLLDPVRLLSELNRQFVQSEDAMRYFTMVYGVMDIDSGHLRLSCAGHPSPLLIHADGSTHQFSVSGVPVGMIEDPRYEEEDVVVPHGSRLVLYSDGIPETEAPDGSSFSIDRLRDHFVANSHRPVKFTLDHLQTALHAWRQADDFADDLSLMVMERQKY